MNIKLMKNLDELLGPSVCLFFHICNSIKKIFIKSPSLLPVNRILLLKFFGMGSIITAGPMIRALKNKYPNARISILTFSGNREICELTGLFDEIILLDTSSTRKLFTEISKKIFYLRRQHYDVCIDLEFFSKFSTIICYLTGARIRAGFFLIQIGILIKMMWRGNLLTHEVCYNQHKHVTDAFLALAKSIGANIVDHAYAPIHVPPAAVDSINAILKNFLKDKDKLVVVNINTSPLCLERRWPKEDFAKLIGKLLSDIRGLKIALIGGKEDLPYTGSFLDSLKTETDQGRIINLTGKLSIAELAALLMRSHLFITNDSGPLHIAVALNRPTVSFFGPETPQRFGPLDRGMHLVMYRDDIYCSPCLNVYNQKTAFCDGDNICLKAIKPEDAYNAIKAKYASLFQNDR